MVNSRGIIIHPDELDESWVERLEEARINVLGLHPVGGCQAHVTLEKALWHRELPDTRRLIRKLQGRGIAVEYQAHAMGWLLPKGLFQYEPEWFRMNEKGERAADINFCVSNQDALDYLSRRAETLARQLETDTDMYYFWLDDVLSGRCQCEKCRDLSTSDQQMLAVNAMLRGIRRYKSTAKLCFLAYHAANEPPRLVAPDEGVFLEYAPMRRDHHKPLFDPTVPENASEVAPLDALIRFFGRENSQVLDYWMDNSMFSNWTKPPKYHVLDQPVMRADVAEYEKRGFERITAFGCYLSQDYRALYGEAQIKEYGEILRGYRG